MTEKITLLDNKIEARNVASRSSTPSSGTISRSQSPPSSPPNSAPKRTISDVDPSSSSADSSEDQDQQAIHSTMNVMSQSLSKIAHFMDLTQHQILSKEAILLMTIWNFQKHKMLLILPFRSTLFPHIIISNEFTT